MQTGQRIAELRTRAGLSQNRLAEHLFVSRDLVSKWETGKSRPDRKMIEAMAALFAVDPEYLIDRDSILSKELASAFPEGYQKNADTLKRDLNDFLSTLNERDRSVFLLRYYYMEDTSEIGEKYGIRDNYVRTVLMRIRKKLKNFLKEERA